MSNSAAINISEDCNQKLLEFKRDQTQRALLLKIENETLVCKEVVFSKSDEISQDFNAIGEMCDTTSASITLIRLGKSVNYPEYLMVVSIPTKSKLRDKTIYAASRATITASLVQLLPEMGNYFVDTPSEFTWDEYIKISKKDNSSLGFDELMQKEESRNATVGQVILPQGSGVDLPLSEELKSSITAISTKPDGDFVAAAADEKGDAIVQVASGSNIAEIADSNTKYIVLRHDGKTVFILYCPDTARSKQKMLISSCKFSFINQCKDAGVEFDHSIEIRDNKELSTDYVASQLSPEKETYGYGEIQVIRKPRRPGRR